MYLEIQNKKLIQEILIFKTIYLTNKIQRLILKHFKRVQLAVSK
jgi:hypothetical protein